jgi:hypothetical protein
LTPDRQNRGQTTVSLKNRSFEATYFDFSVELWSDPGLIGKPQWGLCFTSGFQENRGLTPVFSSILFTLI